jgi:hypothetical protein
VIATSAVSFDWRAGVSLDFLEGLVASDRHLPVL